MRHLDDQYQPGEDNPVPSSLRESTAKKDINSFLNNELNWEPPRGLPSLAVNDRNDRPSEQRSVR